MTVEPVFDMMIQGPVICISCSDDGTKIATGDRNGKLTLADQNGTKNWEKDIDEGIYGLAILGSGNKVACGGKDCKLRMLNSLGNVEWEQTVGKSIWSMAMDPSGQFIAVGTGDSISMYTEGGLQLWEHTTNRAMVGISISGNGALIVGCGDEFLYCLDCDGNLLWEKQRSDSLWDVAVEKDGEMVFVGGWDCKVQCLDKHGEETWNFTTGGYVRSVVPLNDGGILAGSHDGNMYHLSKSGELLEKFETGGEVTCVSASKQMDLAIAGFGTGIRGFRMNPVAGPMAVEDRYERQEIERTPIRNEEHGTTEGYEPMFGAGMFDEPIPDTTGILSRSSEGVGHSTSTSSHYNKESYGTEGGEFREFASEVIKGDVKNYLRLGNAAWIEKKLERAEEHYKRATEVDPEEPRAWHNLAICNYHLALKRNPDNIEGAVKSAFGPLKMAKEKGGIDYESADDTLAYLASQLGLIEED
jgi:hypothetical protein